MEAPLAVSSEHAATPAGTDHNRHQDAGDGAEGTNPGEGDAVRGSPFDVLTHFFDGRAFGVELANLAANDDGVVHVRGLLFGR